MPKKRKPASNNNSKKSNAGRTLSDPSSTKKEKHDAAEILNASRKKK